MPNYDALLEGFTGNPALGDAANPNDPGYMNLEPRTRLQDQRFLSDLRGFYRERDGTEFANDRDLVRHFYSDRNWREINSVSIGRELLDAGRMTADQRARAVRIQQTFDALPSFWQEGGRGVEALADIVPAAVFDPLNLIGGARAVRAGAEAAIRGGSAAWRGARVGAATDATINAAIGAGSEVALQTRDRMIGARDAISGEEVGMATGLGAALGAGFGAVFGAFGGRAGARYVEGLRDAVAPIIAGAPDTIPREEIERYVANAILTDGFRRGVPTMTPEQARQYALDYIQRTQAERATLADQMQSAAEREFQSWEPNRQALQQRDNAAEGAAEVQGWTAPEPPPTAEQTARLGADRVIERIREQLDTNRTPEAGVADAQVDQRLRALIGDLEAVRDFQRYEQTKLGELEALRVENPGKASREYAQLEHFRALWRQLGAHTLRTDDDIDAAISRLLSRGEEPPEAGAAPAPAPAPTSPPPAPAGGGAAAAAPADQTAPTQAVQPAAPAPAAPAQAATPAPAAAAQAAPAQPATPAPADKAVARRLKQLGYKPEDAGRLSPEQTKAIVEGSIRRGTPNDPLTSQPAAAPASPQPAAAAPASEPKPTVAEPAVNVPDAPAAYTKKQAFADLASMGIPEADARAMLRDAKAASKAGDAEGKSAGYARVVAEARERKNDYEQLSQVLEVAGASAGDANVIEALIRATPSLAANAERLLQRYRAEIAPYLLGAPEERQTGVRRQREGRVELTEPQRRNLDAQVKLHEQRLRQQNEARKPEHRLDEAQIQERLAEFREKAIETLTEGAEDRKNPRTSATSRAGAQTEGGTWQLKQKQYQSTGLQEFFFKRFKSFSTNVAGERVADSITPNNAGTVFLVAPDGSRVTTFNARSIPAGELHGDLTGIQALSKMQRGGRPADDFTAPIGFIWEGKGGGRTADGQPLVKGQRVFYNPLTNKLYSSQVLAADPRAAGRAVGPTPPKAPDRPIGSERNIAMQKVLEWFRSGDANDPARLAELNKRLAEINTRQPEQPKAAPAAAVSPAAQPFYSTFTGLPDQTLKTLAAYGSDAEKEAANAVLRERGRVGDATPTPPTSPPTPKTSAPKTSESPVAATQQEVGTQPVVAIRNRVTGEIRAAYANQMNGKTPEQVVQLLLGRASPEEWEAGTLPLSNDARTLRRDRIAAASKDFVPDAGKSATGKVEPKAAPTEPPAPRADEPLLPPSITDPDFAKQTISVGGRQMSVGDAIDRMVALETAEFPPTALDARARVDELVQLYDAIPEFRQSNVAREVAVERVREIFQDPANRSAALDFVRRLGGDPNVAPDFVVAGNAAYRAGRTPDPLAGLNANQVGLPIEAPRSAPHVSQLYHEVSHWAYFNILSNADKRAFWESILRQYDQAHAGGTSIADWMQARSARGIDYDRGRQLGLGSKPDAGGMSTVVSWSRFSPAEYFAEQFEMWMAQNHTPAPDTLWQKIARIFKAIVDRFFRSEAIDPDLEPLFAKILPDEVGASRVALPPVDPKTPAGITALAHLKNTDQARRELEGHLNALSGRELIAHVERGIRAATKPANAADSPLPEALRNEINAAADAAFVKLDEAANRSADTADIAARTVGNETIERLYQVERVYRDAFEAAEGGQPRVGNPHDQVRRDINAATPQGKFVTTLQKRWHDLQQHRIDLQAALNSESLDAPDQVLKIIQAIHGGGPASRGGSGILGMKAVFKRGYTDRWAQVFSEAGDIARSVSRGTVADIEQGIGRKGEGLSVDQAMSRLRAMWPDLANAIDEIDNGLVNRFYKHPLGGYDLRTGSNAYPTPLQTKLLAALEQRRAEAKAKAEATAVNAAAEQKAKPRDTVGQAPGGTEPLPTLDTTTLMERLAAAPARTDLQRNLALEVARRMNLKIVAPASGAYDREMSRLDRNGLVEAIRAGVVSADRDRVSRAIAEVIRRADKSPLHSEELIPPSDPTVNRAIRTELSHLAGQTAEDGIPASAPTAWREMMRRVTHRDPEAQVAARTMLHRMLSILSPTLRRASTDVEVMSVGDLYRLAGKEIPPGVDPKAAFLDFGDPAFNDLRGRLRRVAIGISSGKANPVDVMHEVGHLAFNLLPQGDRDAILQGYINAGGALRSAIDSAYRGHEVVDRANEWFAEGFAEYLAERVSRGNAFAKRLDGTGMDIQLKSRLEVILDRLVEYAAYLLNGLIGRNDIKQMYRRLSLFGDMLAVQRKRGAGFSERVALDPEVAHHASKEILDARGVDRADRMHAYVAGGLGADELGEPIVWYHGTPAGKAFESADVIFSESSGGLLGPGIYVTQNPRLGEGFAGNVSGLVARFVESDAPDSVRRRVGIIGQQRELTMRKLGELLDARAEGRQLDDLDRRIAALRERVEATDARLAELGLPLKPTVLPLVIRVMSPFDAEAPVPRGSEKIRRANAWLADNGYGPIADRDYARGDRSFYDAAVQAVARSFPDRQVAQSEVRRMLQDWGHDGISYTHIGAPAAVVFQAADGSNVKHLNARWFDFGDKRLYHSELPTNEPAFHPAGSIVMAALAHGGEPNVRNALPFLEGINVSGATNVVTDAVRKLLRRDHQADANTADTVRYFSAPLQLRSNASRARKDGASWIADFASPENGTGYYERHASELGRRVVPLFKLMNDLTGNSGISRWKANLKFWGDKPQPEAFGKVAHALRRGDSSQLSQAETQIYDRVRAYFSDELRAMREAGVFVGNAGQDYVPQIWNLDRIEADPDKFRSYLADYFQKESVVSDDRAPISRAEAEAKAQSVYRTLTDENGVYVPPKAEKRSAASDHTDYQRMLRLNEKDRTGKLKYGPELDGLEPFMENDLQALIAKYAENVTRRVEFHKRYGVNNHGFHDYMAVLTYGERAVRDLLEKDKIIRTDRLVPTDLGVETISIEDRLLWAMRPEEAYAAQQRAMDIVRDSKTPGEIRERVSDYLLGLRPDLPANAARVYAKRVEAISNALADFRGKDMPIPAGEIEFLHNMHRSLMGKSITSGPFHESALGASKWLRNFNSVTLLSFTTLASIPDLGMSLIRSGSMGSWVKGMKQFATDPIYRQAIRNVGVAVENIVFENMARLHGGAGGRFSQAFFSATMLEPWTKLQREMAAAVGFEAFRTHVKMMRDNYVPGQVAQNRKFRIAKRFLDHFGLTDYGMTSAKGLDDLSVLDSDPRVREAIVRFSNETIFNPNRNDIPLWAQTPWGALMFQLKSYPLMAGRLAKTVLKEAGEGNVAPLVYMLSVGTGLGATSMAIRDVVQARGGDQQAGEFDRTLKERGLEQIAQNFGWEPNLHGPAQTFLGWYLEGFMTMGGFGMIADTLYQTVAQLDNGAWGQQRIASLLFGPTVGTAQDALTMAAGVLSAATGDDSNAKQRAAVRAVAGRVPGVGGMRDARETIVDTIAGEQ